MAGRTKLAECGTCIEDNLTIFVPNIEVQQVNKILREGLALLFAEETVGQIKEQA